MKVESGVRGRGKVFLLGVFLLAVMLQACGSSQKAQSADQVLVGRLYAIGNEPFVHPGLDVGGTMYELRGSKEIRADLLAHQLRTARVHAASVQDLPSGKMAEVTGVEYVPE